MKKMNEVLKLIDSLTMCDDKSVSTVVYNGEEIRM